jgi:dienelactone hydrolase
MVFKNVCFDSVSALSAEAGGLREKNTVIFRMLRCFLLFTSAFVLIITSKAQHPFQNDVFPQYHPILGQQDLPSNAYPYYAPIGPYSGCISDENGAGSCEKLSLQYVFGPGRQSGDGNSDMDIYYADVVSPDAQNGKPLVVLLHGGSGNRKSGTLSRRAIEFAKRGYVAIIPDYTTARDAIYGSDVSGLELPCFTPEQKLYMLQQSIRDVYAAIRSAMLFSSLNPQNAFLQIDIESIYLHGVSHGAYTGIHMAAMGPETFPLGDVLFENGAVFSFSERLTDLPVCPAGSPCADFQPDPNVSIRSFIKAVGAVAPFTFDIDLFDQPELPPIYLFHGTCDSSAPYWKSTQSNALLRAVWSSDPSVPSALIPCQLENQAQEEIFGSELIYASLVGMANPEDTPHNFLVLCGGRHDIGSVLGPQGNDPNNLQMGLIDYELYRFFANVQNQQFLQGEVQVLDYEIFEAFTPTNYTGQDCEVVHTIGIQWPLIQERCPNCTDDAISYSNNLKLPYFVNGAVDAERYPALAPFLDLLEGCEDAGGQTSFDAGPTKGQTSVNGFSIADVTGQLLFSTNAPYPQGLSQLVQLTRPLKSGYYIVYQHDGSRSSMVIR